MEPQSEASCKEHVFKPELIKIDFLNAEEFFAALLGFIQPGVHLVLDLSTVKFVDSTGLGKIIAALHRIRDRGGDLAIRGVQAPVRVLFSMVQLSEIVTIESLESQAQATRPTASPKSPIP